MVMDDDVVDCVVELTEILEAYEAAREPTYVDEGRFFGVFGCAGGDPSGAGNF